MICSDSLSCLLAIESCKTQIPFILKIVEIYKSLVAIGKHVIFTWIPSPEEATNFKARSIALAYTLKIELADGIRAE
jgi:hypothetical protein